MRFYLLVGNTNGKHVAYPMSAIQQLIQQKNDLDKIPTEQEVLDGDFVRDGKWEWVEIRQELTVAESDKIESAITVPDAAMPSGKRRDGDKYWVHAFLTVAEAWSFDKPLNKKSFDELPLSVGSVILDRVVDIVFGTTDLDAFMNP